ncbi:hypothetical protein [Haloquadratum walsbyi]|jgi:hypothetical protein|uniref:Uncharacterized protein n=1 Tax=Haloquadratum walsbyi J07HQW2 TaxID=1238425 RepID=U1PRQ3_9EURY|nr:hypothetical protein [Haloquadratum walsbyi]ERG96437.1 MAG: hypothetical protein J07HQW2_02916 [Haloquadratum walsbyi J07HQW2]
MDSADDALAACFAAVERAVSESTVTDPIDLDGVSPNYADSAAHFPSVSDPDGINTPENTENDGASSDLIVTGASCSPDTNNDISFSLSDEQILSSTTSTNTDVEIVHRVEKIESCPDSITGELAAIRGLIESVGAIDEVVEQRANIALAKVEAIELGFTEDSKQTPTTESETPKRENQHVNEEMPSKVESAVTSNQTTTHDTT